MTTILLVAGDASGELHAAALARELREASAARARCSVSAASRWRRPASRSSSTSTSSRSAACVEVVRDVGQVVSRLAAARPRAGPRPPRPGGAGRLAGLLHPLRAARAARRSAGALLREPAGVGLAALPHPRSSRGASTAWPRSSRSSRASTRAPACASSSWAIRSSTGIPPPAARRSRRGARRASGSPPARGGGAAAREPAQRAARLAAAPARRRARSCSARIPRSRFALALAPSLSREALDAQLARGRPRPRARRSACSRAPPTTSCAPPTRSITKPGTATVEIALLGTPHASSRRARTR